NTDGDAAFGEKKPESEVNVSLSSSAQSKKHDDKNKREAKGKSPVESFTGYRNLSAEFKDFSNNSINEVNAAGTLVPAVGQIFPNNTNTFSTAEDITYSDDEDDVGAEADFNNLETSITVSPILTTRVHKDHHVTQIIGDLSSATQTRSMIKVAKDQGFEDPDYPNKVYKVVKALYGLHQASRACPDQMVSGKDSSNPLMDDNLQKIVWYSTHHVALMKSWLVQKQMDLGVNTPRSDEDRLELMELTVFLLPSDKKVRVKVSVVDLQVSAVRLILLLLVQKFILFGLTNWCCSLSDVSSIKYALTLNPNIYVSYIKQFWTSVAVKKVNDVTRLQALVEQEEELARMVYAKPSTNLTFYKAFFSSQWKFLIHTILQCMSAKRTSWNEFSSSMASTVICLSSGKGFFRVETPLFEGMIVEQQVAKGADEVHDEGVPAAGIVAEDDVIATNNKVPTEEPSIPSPTPPTPPPQPSQDQPLTSQDVGISMDLLQNLMDTCTTLTRRVEHLEHDKIAQALEIAKLKSRGGISANIDADKDVVLEDAKDVAVDKSADEEELEPAEIQEVVDVVTTAMIITEVVTAASDAIAAASTTITAADVPIPAATIVADPTLTAAPSRRTKGVVIRDPEETTTTSTIIHSEAKSKDKGKWILVEEPKPLKKQAQIEQDEQYAKKEDKSVKRYQALKRKPQTEAQARKNMMIYLKNVAGFKMDYFKGMSYDDIRPVFEKYFDSNMAFLQKTKEQMDKEDSRALKRMNEKRRYPLTRFTLDQMINNVRLEVEEESEVSLKLLRFIRQQHQEGT
nr:hypothetical protein [Tanacetum cinerariifolium]